MTHGPRRIPVILVAFTDVDYSISDPRNKFDALLNQNGYSYNGGTGSVQDYYYDNSHGEFQPIFDVYGPVTLSHPMAYYGAPVQDASGNVVLDIKDRPVKITPEPPILSLPVFTAPGMAFFELYAVLGDAEYSASSPICRDKPIEVPVAQN